VIRRSKNGDIMVKIVYPSDSQNNNKKLFFFPQLVLKKIKKLDDFFNEHLNEYLCIEIDIEMLAFEFLINYLQP